MEKRGGEVVGDFAGVGRWGGGDEWTEKELGALFDLQQVVTLSPFVCPKPLRAEIFTQCPLCFSTPSPTQASPPPPLTAHAKIAHQAIATGVESIPEYNAYTLNGCFSMPPVRCHQQMGS